MMLQPRSHEVTVMKVKKDRHSGQAQREPESMDCDGGCMDSCFRRNDEGERRK